MGAAVDVVLRRLARSGLRRGLAGEHWAWLAIAGAAYVLRRARQRDDLVTAIDLQPGEGYLLSLQGPTDPAVRGVR
jgi:hypothetical protein